jgi:hypothetical protein
MRNSAEAEAHHADHEGERHRVEDEFLGAAARQRFDRGGRHQRQQRDRAGVEEARGAPHRRHHHRQEGGVQAIDHRQTGQGGVGHRLRDQDQRHGDAGDEIAAQVLALEREPAQEGEKSAQHG